MLWQWSQNLVRRLPSQCAVCHAWPSQPVCEACVQLFAQPCPRCRRCALPTPTGQDLCGDCITTPPVMDAALTAVAYAFPWSRLVLEFKFAQNPGWARSMALLMRSAPWVEPALERADLVLPIPLSAQRLQERGFNQALLLARALAPDKTRGQVLLRVRNTAAQSSLPRSERLTNVQHAFAVDPAWQAEVEGKRVVLVDDVMTSGASLGAAAACLRQAGAVHVTSLVFARAERGA
ncbi:MAG: phosphoribosyltransferase family protein [Rhodoferax sp.]|nr:phosphoribosyltransferase family protein [Rhodoferax sp.]